MKTINTLTKPIFFWIVGFLAFVWFILRNGTNPKRLTYPCQIMIFNSNSVQVLNKDYISTNNKCLINIKLNIGVYVIKALANGHSYAAELFINQ